MNWSPYQRNYPKTHTPRFPFIFHQDNQSSRICLTSLEIFRKLTRKFSLENGLRPRKFILKELLKLTGRVCWFCLFWKEIVWSSWADWVELASRCLLRCRQVPKLSDRILDCLLELTWAFCFLPSINWHSSFEFGSDCYRPLQSQLGCSVWYFWMSWWSLKESSPVLPFKVCFDWVCRLWLWSCSTCFVQIPRFTSVIFFGFEVFGRDWTEENFPCKDFLYLLEALKSIARNQLLTLNPKAVKLVLAQNLHGRKAESYCKEQLHVYNDWCCWPSTIKNFQYHRFQSCQQFLKADLIVHPQWPNCFQQMWPNVGICQSECKIMILGVLPNPNYRHDVFLTPKCHSKRIHLSPFESYFGPFWFTFFLQRRPSFPERSLIRR